MQHVGRAGLEPATNGLTDEGSGLILKIPDIRSAAIIFGSMEPDGA